MDIKKDSKSIRFLQAKDEYTHGLIDNIQEILESNRRHLIFSCSVDAEGHLRFSMSGDEALSQAIATHAVLGAIKCRAGNIKVDLNDLVRSNIDIVLAEIKDYLSSQNFNEQG